MRTLFRMFQLGGAVIACCTLGTICLGYWTAYQNRQDWFLLVMAAPFAVCILTILWALAVSVRRGRRSEDGW